MLLMLLSRLWNWSWVLLADAWLDTLSWEDEAEGTPLHRRLGLPQLLLLPASPGAGTQWPLLLNVFSRGSEEEKIG